MKTTPGIARLLRAVALLIAFHALLAYGLPPLLLVALVLALGIWFRRSDWRAAMTVSLSLVFATLVYAAALAITGLDEAWYYRPYELLATWDYDAGLRRYRPDGRVEMRMPHGDLQGLTRTDIARPRDIVFRTDALGWRNDEIGNYDWVLVGDSFVAGLGESQDGLIQAWLEREQGIRAYNLGYPGDPTDYVIRLDRFREQTGSTVPVVLFLFEGNDFREKLDDPDSRKPSAFTLFWKRYYRLFDGTSIYRFTASLIKRVSRYGAVVASTRVTFEEIGDEVMGFYEPHDVVTWEETYEPDPSVESVLARIAGQSELIVFIPTKRRVYQMLLHPGDPLPNARWLWLEGLCARRGWPCLDLTPALVEAAGELAAHGEYVWWPDDTHWNAAGMAVAARVVGQRLSQSAE